MHGDAHRHIRASQRHRGKTRTLRSKHQRETVREIPADLVQVHGTWCKAKSGDGESAAAQRF